MPAETLRVAFVFANPRQALLEAIARDEAPDTGLLGQNHLAALGIEAEIRDSLLHRRHRAPSVVQRLAWVGREITLPIELRGFDVVCTPVGPTLPLVSRATRGPRTVLFNMSLCQTLRRSRGARRRLLASGVRAADAVICFADAQRDNLIELTGAEPERVHSVCLGVDERFLESSGPPPAGGPVLAVGRDLGRDYRTLVAALDGLESRAIIVASGRNLAGISLPSNVEVRLDVSAVELRALYEQAACVVVPTRHEDYEFGADCSGQTVVLDAFAMRRPVVASERSTLRGYIDHGRNGLIVPAEDPAALRSAVDALLGDPGLALRLGEQGRVDVEERFTTRRLAQSLAALLPR